MRHLHTPLATRHRPRRATTVMELMVVLFIVVIVATASVTAYVNFRRASVVRNDALKIEKLLGAARSYAISTNAPHQATFRLAKGSFWIDEISGLGDTVAPKVVSPERLHPEVRVTQFTGGVATNDGETVSLRFYPDGSCDAATVQLLRKGDDPARPENYHTLKLYGPTGRATLFENQKI